VQHENGPYSPVDRNRLLQAAFVVSRTLSAASEGSESGKPLAVAGWRTKIAHDFAVAPAVEIGARQPAAGMNQAFPASALTTGTLPERPE